MCALSNTFPPMSRSIVICIDCFQYRNTAATALLVPSAEEQEEEEDGVAGAGEQDFPLPNSPRAEDLETWLCLM